MNTFFKSAIVIGVMLLSVFSYAQQAPSNAKSEETATYVENEFIIWLEQGVEASTFAAKCDVAIVPKD